MKAADIESVLIDKPAENQENLKYLIDLMNRVASENLGFTLGTWQSRDESEAPITTIEQLIASGRQACVGGWLAVSPIWKDQGGSVDLGTGGPVCLKFPVRVQPIDAVAEWLGVSRDMAAMIMGFRGFDDGETFSLFYGKEFQDIGAADVALKLQELIA